MNTSVATKFKKTAIGFTTLLALVGCGSNSTSDLLNQSSDIPAQERTTEEVLVSGSPWATTGVFLTVDGVADKSVNFIEDETISQGTISSAQYRDGTFIFVGMTDFRVGSFDEASLVQSLDDVVANDASPSGFSFGDYRVVRNAEGNPVRRIRNASFAPTAVIDREITVANADEFGYIFTAQDGMTYFVEHKPYAQAFPGATFPDELQASIENFFNDANTEEKRVDYVLNTASPWATTAIFLETDGELDTTTNFITDPTISAGTISSARYRDGQFIFVGLSDFTTGEFDLTTLVPSLTSTDGSQPNGFSFGDFEILTNDQGDIVRRITNASFAPTATIDRNIEVVTMDLFTYSFQLDGNTYHVEHRPYAQAFPGAEFPEELQTAIDQFFNML